MKLGIMQPYIFPYLGYFQLIQHTDSWVIFDNIQFSSKSWVNRNRILHPEAGKDWQYFTVPIKKHSLSTKINELSINNQIEWKKQLLGKLSHYKKKAPFYIQTINFINENLNEKYCKLDNLLINSLENTCSYLGIDFNYQVFSNIEFNNEVISSPGDWALNISKQLQATEYINPPSGFNIFNEKSFREAGIKLSFLTSELPDYTQKREAFSPGLSIIDIMMWNSTNDIKEMLNRCNFNSYDELLKIKGRSI